MENVEDIYPLSPMQEGMLFHTISAPESGVYFEQYACTLQGTFDAAAFQEAWRRVVHHHPALRTAFLWDELDEPLQVVRRQVTLPWVHLDWRDVAPREQQDRLTVLLDEDRSRGFDLAQAPLMRMTLIRLADEAWRFVWSFHHLLADGWSTGLILQQVFACYRALRAGTTFQVDAPRPYRDFIAWLQQRDQRQGEDFWRARLEGFDAHTPLGIDQPGASASAHTAPHRQQHVAVSPETSAAVQAFAREHRLTLNTIIQGAWALLLSRYSGQEDVLFGTTVSGRPAALPGVEQMIGLFINTLPVRVQVTRNQTLVPWLQALQTQLVALHEHEQTPLVAIQSWSGLPAGERLFDSLIVFENYPAAAQAAQEAEGLSVSQVRYYEQSNFPLALLVVPGTQLHLHAVYAPDRFEDVALTRLLEHVQVLLEGIVADPSRRLADLPLLTNQERHQLLVAWNDTQADPAQDDCIHHWFERQSARVPDAQAVVFENEALTYRALDGRANQLAHHLRLLGVGPGVRVAFCVDRSLDMLVGILGILKAGGAYVPLDPAYPAPRLRFMLNDAAASVLLTQAHLVPELPETDATVLCLDADWSTIEAAPQVNPATDVGGDHLAYVIYTSGSTGQPKGVMVTHRNLVHSTWARTCFYHEPVGRFLLLSSVAFDSSVAGIFWTLCTGGTLVLPRKGTEQDLALLTGVIEAQQITHTLCLPSLYSLVLEQARAAQLASLRTVIAAGEALPAELAARHYARLPETDLVNEYGPTEATVWSTAYRVPRGFTGRSVPIGHPIANTQAYVLDPHLQLLPVGLPGELYLGGPGLARGYLNRPDITAEHFLDNPLKGTPSARLYRSGDLVRYRADGTLEFLGRRDDQLKLRGFRVEPGEVERVLEAHAQVREAVVVAAPDPSGDHRLLAYLTLHDRGSQANGDVAIGEAASPGGAFSTQMLRAFLQERLPEFMVPAAFLVLEAMPLTPNGKVDRRRLPSLANYGAAEAGPDGREAAPRTPLEQLLAQFWTELMGLSRVSRHDNFFELGGHSLMAVRLLSRIRAVLSLELPMRVLFQHPTVAALARQLEEALTCAPSEGTSSEALPAEAPLRPVPRMPAMPLSFAQQRLWLLAQLEPDSPAYNIALGWRLRGPLQAKALQESLQRIIDRHETLRSAFRLHGDEPVVVIAPTLRLALPVTDLSALAPSAREEALQHLAAEEASAGFSLAQAPLFRMRLVCLAEQEHVLLVTLHHIIFDGWSAGLFLHELSRFYAAHVAAGEAAPLPEGLPALPVQYADFACWQRRHLQGARLAQQLAYWRKQLKDVPTLALPTDRPRPPRQRYDGAVAQLLLPSKLTSQLKALARQEQVTLFMMLLGAFQVLLGRWSGQEDVAVGAPVAGRTRQELELLIGFFVGTLVLRTDLSGAPSFSEVLARVRRVSLEAYAHQDIPFEKLVEELQPRRDASRTPLFQVFFNMLNLEAVEALFPGLAVAPFRASVVRSKFDLTLYVGEEAAAEGREEASEGAASEAGALSVRAVYNTDLFEAETIAELLAQYRLLLEQVVASPQEPVGRLSLVTPAARAVLPGPSRVLPRAATGSAAAGSTLLGRLAEQAARVAERTALRDAAGSWSYAMLAQCSDHLGQRLRGMGVGRGSVVALYADRSAALVWGLVGVLKVGAAFTVLDAAYPSARLAEQVAQARPRAAVVLAGAGRLPEGLRVALRQGGCRVLVELPSRLTEAFRVESMLQEEASELERGLTGEALTGDRLAGEEPMGGEALAYIAFTSGSTGRPKGILGTCAPVAHFLSWHIRHFGLSEQDRFSLLSGLGHDPLLRDVFTPLWLGATLCIPSSEQLEQARAFLAWMRRERVSVAHLTPALGQVLISALPEAALAEAAAPPGVLPSLRYAFFGGDVLRWRQVHRLRALAPRVRCVNFYGATETPQAVGYYEASSAAEAAKAGPRQADQVPVGCGIEAVELLVLNGAERLAGIGELGEICVRTPYLSRGYLDDAELTRARFVVNPYTGEASDVVYRTGDLGRYGRDGSVQLVGRLDDQVQLRGHRVEPGEIAAVLSEVGWVRASVVRLHEDEAGEGRLVAYVVVAKEASEAKASEVPSREAAWSGALRRHVQGRLPAFMVPSLFVFLEQLPLTPNGKLDVEALPAPGWGSAPVVEAHTEVERRIAAIWSRVLGVERVGVETDFFEMGGHSLMAMRVLARVEEAFGVEVPLRRFFEGATVRRLAGAVEELRARPGVVRGETEIKSLARQPRQMKDPRRRRA